jgi:hypothetical protein
VSIEQIYRDAGIKPPAAKPAVRHSGRVRKRRFVPPTDRPARPATAATAEQVAKARDVKPAEKEDAGIAERLILLLAKAVERPLHITLPPPPANIVNINDAPLLPDDELEATA